MQSLVLVLYPGNGTFWLYAFPSLRNLLSSDLDGREVGKGFLKLCHGTAKNASSIGSDNEWGRGNMFL